MLQLLMLLLVAPGPGMPDTKIQDRALAPTAVNDKMLRPIKPRDCKNEAEVQRAVLQVRAGEAGDCFVRDVRAFNRYKG